MSDNQIAELHERLIKAKFKIEGLKARYPFQLGWNAAMDAAIKHIGAVCDDDLPADEPAREVVR